jgi:hypothetical protein
MPPALRLDEGKQLSVDLILMRGREAVRRAFHSGALLDLMDLQPRRRNRRPSLALPP